ncbi:MAG: hypothetical protein EBX52_06825 [Proteobacteria bacterium]|nr:hypothetical protein [Pseudomonadota bacterium]
MILLTALIAGWIVFLPSIRSGAARVLFRAWVPVWRWRYFDEAGDTGCGHSSSDPVRLGPAALFLNPKGNLRHLENTLRDLEDGS